MLIPSRISSITLTIAAALLLLAAWLIFHGITILKTHATLTAQTYQSRVPLDGSYTQEELELAKSQIALFSSATQPGSLDLENAVRGQREMELARQSVWQRRQLHLIQLAAQRRPVGWVLIGLGSSLLVLWAFAGYRLLTAR